MTIVETLTRRSVLINGVLCPFPTIGRSLKRFARPALFYSEGTSVEMSMSGSVLLVGYRQRLFAVLTRHQLGRPGTLGHHEVKNFVLITRLEGGKSVALTPAEALHPVASAGFENLSDLTIVEYHEAQFVGKARPEFYNLDLEAQAGRPVFSVAIGYPHYAVDFSISDEGAIENMSMASATLYLADALTREPFDPEHRRLMVQHRRAQKMLDSPDGMSGAPVFAIERSGDGLCCRLAGIITDARERRFAVLPAEPLRRALDLFFTPQD